MRLIRHLLPAVVATAGLAAPVAIAPTAHAAPTCAGLKATIVGNDRANSITGTPRRDVVVARGGNDREPALRLYARLLRLRLLRLPRPGERPAARGERACLLQRTPLLQRAPLLRRTRPALPRGRRLRRAGSPRLGDRARPAARKAVDAAPRLTTGQGRSETTRIAHDASRDGTDTRRHR